MPIPSSVYGKDMAVLFPHLSAQSPYRSTMEKQLMSEGKLKELPFTLNIPPPQHTTHTNRYTPGPARYTCGHLTVGGSGFSLDPSL